MKRDIVEYLGLEDDEKRKVGRPKLADNDTKKKSIIIASCSFLIVVILLLVGYGTLFGFNNLSNLLKGNLNNKTSSEKILVEDLEPIVKNLTMKVGTARKVYLTITPANASNKNIKYTSSNNKIATVDKNGKVTAKSAGKTIITATSLDGSLISTEFEIKVVKDASGSCDFDNLTKNKKEMSYEISCDNAEIKEIQYKVADGNYQTLLSKKSSGSVEFSEEQLNQDITFKIVYNANNSSVNKYVTKKISGDMITTKADNGYCTLDIFDVKKDSARYDITCRNASVSKIAYKLGTEGSYIGLENSNLADTIIYEESTVTRVLYFKVDYVIDGTTTIKTISKSSIVGNGIEKEKVIVE